MTEIVIAYFNGEKNAAIILMALGLLIHAAVPLAFDIVAERRRAVYFAALNRP